MRLAILHHLQAVLDHAQSVVGCAQHFRIACIDPACRCECIQCRPCASDPQAFIAPAMDQLMGLRVKLDLADAAAPLLHIKAGAGHSGAIVIIANAPGELAHFLHCAKIHR